MTYLQQKITKESGLKLTNEVVDIIVEGMSDNNRGVREAAYSTWVSVVEMESDQVTEEMLSKVTQALKTYS
jgi:oligoendopeptidase F